MENLQRNICNALTFLFLVGVVAAGAVSLWPEAQPAPLTGPEPEEELAEPVPADTLDEVPMVEDVKEVKETCPDSLPADTAAATPRPALPADTARHAAPHAAPHATVPHTVPATPAETKPAPGLEADSAAHT